ncbi:hypothetical protein Dsin_005232 [Dipteronia sinensis]|uniref:LOB domain-containing protein n=1 Tax=Dipteronia sinensis TaxID=43782 RepID=A0AAE0EGB1_9ROSI|nr:hypothetical protein Dsin_005232 [Dipteronia sinensis]
MSLPMSQPLRFLVTDNVVITHIVCSLQSSTSKMYSRLSFSPYFRSDQPQKFQKVHRIFGTSNVAKLINELDEHLWEQAANSSVYEAEARMLNLVYRCTAIIWNLQGQLKQAEIDLDNGKKELAAYIGLDSMMPAVSQYQLLWRNMWEIQLHLYM